MDLRSIIASCLIPVLFGFLAEAMPHYYHSESPAALHTNDDYTDRDYGNNYGNQDDYEEPPLAYDTDTRFSDWEHDKNDVDYFNFREPQYIDPPSKIIKVFKVMKIIHRNDMQGKRCRKRGFAFDSMRGRCVRN